MDIAEKICYSIICISLIAIAYITINYLRFIRTVELTDISRWVKETISLLTFYTLFTMVISVAFEILRKVKREKKSALAPYAGAAI